MLKLSFCLFFLIFSINTASSQNIITAARYLESVSERFKEITDLEANVIIRSGNSEMSGKICYLASSNFIIEISRPTEQIILFNGEMLTIYSADLNAVLSQEVTQNKRSPTSSINSQGLNLLIRNFVPSYLISPHPVLLDPNSRENVIKLKLTSRFPLEGFKEIILSIDPNTKLIRRLEGQTIANETVRFDFINSIVNQGIPVQRFIFNPPSLINVYDNFLF